MKKGLFSKMLVAYTMIIAVSFFIIATVLSFWFQGYYYDQKKNQLLSGAEIIKPYAVGWVGRNIPLEVLDEIIILNSKLFNTDIFFIDIYGYIDSTSNKEDKIVQDKQFNLDKKDRDKLRSNIILEKKADYENPSKGMMNTLEIPIITSNGTYVGAIIMNTSASEIKEPLKEVYFIIWISAVFAMIISCIVIYYFSKRIIIKPLEKINYAAGKISKGEVEKRVSIESNDEIGELARSFNSMADSIEEVEKNRREFISNVSHEIRSPITSIKGFIGGILDGVIPKEKENYYLSIAYEEIQRLTRLINDLLDLSSIEAGKFSLRIEELNINEIIRLTVIKSETRIKAKKLNVDVCFLEDKLYIAGDRDRLTQVVTNLLDNAIKYVHQGGNIKIATKIKGDKVHVSVFNDGPSIPKDEIKNIWERFYKSDKSRTSKMSTGLGLPIIRSILTQLGEDIWVENKEEGVTFVFTLKRV